jgi:hypothetical protein
MLSIEEELGKTLPSRPPCGAMGNEDLLFAKDAPSANVLSLYFQAQQQTLEA